MQFRVVHLLIAAVVVAMYGVAVNRDRAVEANTMLLIAAFSGVFGLAWGWWKRSRIRRAYRLGTTAGIYSTFNLFCWMLHRSTIFVIRENDADLEFAKLMQAFVQLDRWLFFDVVALVIGLTIIWCWRMRAYRQKMAAVGSFMLFYWFGVFAIGYLLAGMTFFQDRGLS